MMTVRELAIACQREIEKGNGDKKVLLSDDTEGNGFHELCYSFYDKIEELELDKDIYNSKDFIVLG